MSSKPPLYRGGFNSYKVYNDRYRFREHPTASTPTPSGSFTLQIRLRIFPASRWRGAKLSEAMAAVPRPSPEPVPWLNAGLSVAIPDVTLSDGSVVVPAYTGGITHEERFTAIVENPGEPVYLTGSFWRVAQFTLSSSDLRATLVFDYDAFADDDSDPGTPSRDAVRQRIAASFLESGDWPIGSLTLLRGWPSGQSGEQDKNFRVAIPHDLPPLLLPTNIIEVESRNIGGASSSNNTPEDELHRGITATRLGLADHPEVLIGGELVPAEVPDVYLAQVYDPVSDGRLTLGCANSPTGPNIIRSPINVRTVLRPLPGTSVSPGVFAPRKWLEIANAVDATSPPIVDAPGAGGYWNNLEQRLRAEYAVESLDPGLDGKVITRVSPGAYTTWSDDQLEGVITWTYDTAEGVILSSDAHYNRVFLSSSDFTDFTELVDQMYLSPNTARCVGDYYYEYSDMGGVGFIADVELEVFLEYGFGSFSILGQFSQFSSALLGLRQSWLINGSLSPVSADVTAVYQVTPAGDFTGNCVQFEYDNEGNEAGIRGNKLMVRDNAIAPAFVVEPRTVVYNGSGSLLFTVTSQDAPEVVSYSKMMGQPWFIPPHVFRLRLRIATVCFRRIPLLSASGGLSFNIAFSDDDIPVDSDGDTSDVSLGEAWSVQLGGIFSAEFGVLPPQIPDPDGGPDPIFEPDPPSYPPLSPSGVAVGHASELLWASGIFEEFENYDVSPPDDGVRYWSGSSWVPYSSSVQNALDGLDYTPQDLGTHQSPTGVQVEIGPSESPAVWTFIGGSLTEGESTYARARYASLSQQYFNQWLAYHNVRLLARTGPPLHPDSVFSAVRGFMAGDDSGWVLSGSVNTLTGEVSLSGSITLDRGVPRTIHDVLARFSDLELIATGDAYVGPDFEDKSAPFNVVRNRSGLTAFEADVVSTTTVTPGSITITDEDTASFEVALSAPPGVYSFSLSIEKVAAAVSTHWVAWPLLQQAVEVYADGETAEILDVSNTIQPGGGLSMPGDLLFPGFNPSAAITYFYGPPPPALPGLDDPFWLTVITNRFYAVWDFSVLPYITMVPAGPPATMVTDEGDLVLGSYARELFKEEDDCDLTDATFNPPSGLPEPFCEDVTTIGITRFRCRYVCVRRRCYVFNADTNAYELDSVTLIFDGSGECVGGSCD